MKEITDLYNYFNRVLNSRFNPRDWTHDYRNAVPSPMLVLDDFLPQQIFEAVYKEAQSLPDYLWTNFTRNHSFMRECKTFDDAPMLTTLTHCFNSSNFVTWLEGITKNTKIIPDPHLVGAGLSRCHRGNFLNLHTDFNWNDELQLNRALSMILYINPEWQDPWGGALEFWDHERQSCVTKVAPRPNRLLIWQYDDRLLHGYPTPLACPEDQYRLNLRMFYYSSNSTPITPPHRSLYWWDDDSKTPLDDRTQI